MDNFSFNLLKIFSERSSLSLIELAAILNCNALDLSEPINYLRENNYLSIKSDFPTSEDKEFLSLRDQLAITFQGKQALELETKNRKHFKHNEFRAWVTLTIAVAAFIKSFFF